MNIVIDWFQNNISCLEITLGADIVRSRSRRFAFEQVPMLSRLDVSRRALEALFATTFAEVTHVSSEQGADVLVHEERVWYSEGWVSFGYTRKRADGTVALMIIRLLPEFLSDAQVWARKSRPSGENLVLVCALKFVASQVLCFLCCQLQRVLEHILHRTTCRAESEKNQEKCRRDHVVLSVCFFAKVWLTTIE